MEAHLSIMASGADLLNKVEQWLLNSIVSQNHLRIQQVQSRVLNCIHNMSTGGAGNTVADGLGTKR